MAGKEDAALDGQARAVAYPYLVSAEGIMKLKEMFLCIDCDEVFTSEGSRCNPQCPTCASSVFMPLSAWVQTMTAFERGRGEAERVTHHEMTEGRPRIALVHSTPAAA